MSLKLLHTADVHLDAPFRWLGSKGQAQRDQVRDTFRRLVDLALTEHVDVFLVAGDLFDSNSPSQDSIDLVLQQLRRLTMPVFLLPGTHDCLDATSIYRKITLQGAGAHVHLFDREHQAFNVSAVDLTVHGSANLTKTSSQSPICGLRRSPGTRFNIAMAHGSLNMRGAEGDFPFSSIEIDESRMDYIALGHWHSYRNCSGKSVAACYSGPPELLGEDQDGATLIVELTDSGPKITPHNLSKRRWRRLTISVDGVDSIESLRMRIASVAGIDTIAGVELTGLRPIELVLDAAGLEREMAADFFSLRLSDRTRGLVSSQQLDAFPPDLVIGRFVARMREVMCNATQEEEKRLCEKALQAGVALLQGQRVL